MSTIRPGDYVHWTVELRTGVFHRYGCVMDHERQQKLRYVHTPLGHLLIQASNARFTMPAKDLTVVNDLPFDAVTCDQKATYENWNHLQGV